MDAILSVKLFHLSWIFNNDTTQRLQSFTMRLWTTISLFEFYLNYRRVEMSFWSGYPIKAIEQQTIRGYIRHEAQALPLMAQRLKAICVCSGTINEDSFWLSKESG